MIVGDKYVPNEPGAVSTPNKGAETSGGGNLDHSHPSGTKKTTVTPKMDPFGGDAPIVGTTTSKTATYAQPPSQVAGLLNSKIFNRFLNSIF